MTSGYVPDAGDLVWLNLDPRAGHEQAGRRPALILSPAAYNGRAGLAFVCPVTSRVRGRRLEVPLPDRSKVSGVVLAEHLRSVDWRARRAAFVARAPAAALAAVRARLVPLLGL